MQQRRGNDLISIVILFQIVCVVMLCCVNVESKVCSSIDIRNHPSALKKLENCTVIVGYLKILLFDTVENKNVFSDYSFPKLTEITGYLLLYRITQLTSLDILFPNLRVIRGVNLFTNYALIMFNMPHLQQVGVLLSIVPK